jgi:septum site-determining protein MinD
VTRTRPDDPVTPEAVAEELDEELLVAIPDDDNVRASVHAGTPLVVHEPESPAAQAYRYLAARLLGNAGDDERPRFDATATESTAGTTESTDGGEPTDAESVASADDVSNAISEVDDEDGGDGDRVAIPDAEADDAGDPETRGTGD